MAIVGHSHELKTWPTYFQAIYEGNKTFEVRKMDRDFKAGDIVWLREYDPACEEDATEYTGRYLFARITYVLKGGALGIAEGYCVFSFELTSSF